MGEEESQPQEKGEIIQFMEDIKRESESMMKDLNEMDSSLIHLKMLMEKDSVDKQRVIDIIESIRRRIGVLENVDQRELREEEVAESLLQKLKKWVDQVV